MPQCADNMPTSAVPIQMLQNALGTEHGTIVEHSLTTSLSKVKCGFRSSIANKSHLHMAYTQTESTPPRALMSPSETFALQLAQETTVMYDTRLLTSPWARTHIYTSLRYNAWNSVME